MHFNMRSPDHRGHLDPRAQRAGADRDAELDVGAGDDVLVVAGWLRRALLRPIARVLAALRRVVRMG